MGHILELYKNRKWLVILEKPHTAVGRKTVKSVIVECERKDVEKKVVKDDCKIFSIEDWDLLQANQHKKNIEYLWFQSNY